MPPMQEKIPLIATRFYEPFTGSFLASAIIKASVTTFENALVKAMMPHIMATVYEDLTSKNAKEKVTQKCMTFIKIK